MESQSRRRTCLVALACLLVGAAIRLDGTAHSSIARVNLGTFRITAYAIRGTTKSGTETRDGRTVAVDPKVIPLGTILEIDGIGPRVAEDTGRKVKGKHIDVFMPSYRIARQFGVQRAQVTVAHPLHSDLP